MNYVLNASINIENEDLFKYSKRYNCKDTVNSLSSSSTMVS